MDIPPAALLIPAVFELLEKNGIPPNEGLDAILAAAATVGVRLCQQDDATMEQSFRDWIARAHNLQHRTGRA